jgi:hypothetical protein
MAQDIRYILYFLEASFKEILLNEGETVMSKNSLMKTKFKEEP